MARSFHLESGPLCHSRSFLALMLHFVSQERMSYITDDQSADGIAKVTHQSKSLSSTRSGSGKTSKTFDALDWLAQLTTQILSEA